MLIGLWVTIALNSAINTNNAWWLMAAQRWLNGGTPYRDFYDTNPPWIIWFYALQVLTARVTYIPLYYMPALFGTALLVLSVASCNHLLKKFPEFTSAERIIFLSSYVTACTVLTTTWSYSDRDHLITLMLAPLLLAQLALTNHKNVEQWLLWPIILISGLIILAKPHYGLLPVIMVTHRMIIQKHIVPVFKDPDFIGLSACVLLYITCFFTIFKDFIFYMMSDIVLLYIGATYSEFFFQTLHYATIVIILLFAVPLLYFENRERKVLTSLLGGSLICVGLFYLQKKGFHYHLIPALTFFYIGFGLLIFYLAKRATKNFHDTLAWSIALLLAIFSLGFYKMPNEHLTHREYKSLELPTLLTKCLADCNFFILSENMDIVNEGTLYANKQNASRFPHFWWLPAIAQNLNSQTSSTKVYKSLKDKYINLAAEDLARFKPDYILIVKNMKIENLDNFNVRDFLTSNKNFYSQLNAYNKVGVYRENRGDYFKGALLDYDYELIYDMYERKGISQNHKISRSFFENK